MIKGENETNLINSEIQDLLLSLRGVSNEERLKLLQHWVKGLRASRGEEKAVLPKLELSDKVLAANSRPIKFTDKPLFQNLGKISTEGVNLDCSRFASLIHNKDTKDKGVLTYEAFSIKDFKSVADVTWVFELGSSKASNSHRQIDELFRDRGLAGMLFKLSEDALKKLGIHELSANTIKPATAAALINLGYVLQESYCNERVLGEIKNNLGNFETHFKEDILEMVKKI